MERETFKFSSSKVNGNIAIFLLILLWAIILLPSGTIKEFLQRIGISTIESAIGLSFLLLFIANRSPRLVEVDENFLYLHFIGKPIKLAWNEILEFQKMSISNFPMVNKNDIYFIAAKKLNIFHKFYGFITRKKVPITTIHTQTDEHNHLFRIIENKLAETRELT